MRPCDCCVAGWMSACRFNSAEALLYVGMPSALVLVGGSLLLDGPEMLAVAAKLWQTGAMEFLRAWSMSSLVNLTSYLAIYTTSSLTFKVAGCLKNLVVVWYGVVVHGDNITHWHLLGYAVSVAGFVLYTISKSCVAAKPSGKQQAEQKKTQ